MHKIILCKMKSFCVSILHESYSYGAMIMFAEKRALCVVERIRCNTWYAVLWCQASHARTHRLLLQYTVSSWDHGEQLGVIVLEEQKCSRARMYVHENIGSTWSEFGELIRILWKLCEIKLHRSVKWTNLFVYCCNLVMQWAPYGQKWNRCLQTSSLGET